MNLEDPVYAPLLGDQVDIGWSRSEQIPVITDGDSHSIVMPGEQSPLTLRGKAFEPKGLHFHSPSEHLVHGKSYPMEMHIVHQNEQDGSRAVIGVFLDGAGESGSVSDRAFSSLLDSLEKGGKSLPPTDLLPRESHKFYRYEGSLTTTPFDENVSWMVLKEPIHLAPETLARLKEERGHEAREVQELNRRHILANFRETV